MKCKTQEDLFHLLGQNPEPGWFARSLTDLQITEKSGWPDQFGDALRKWNLDNHRRELRTLSLFSGGGGLDIGFHDAGFNIVESLEIEPAFAKTLEINAANNGRLAGTRVICGDINHYQPTISDIEFIIGGPPCQTFSAAGARAAGVNGTDDDRGNLFLQYARIINQLQPRGFLFENVYRIVGAQSGKAWKQIQAAFEELGYKLFWRILDAADYGVPQFRERLIIVGLKNGEFLFPEPSHGPDSPDRRNYYCSKDAISDLKYYDEIKAIGGRHGHLLNDIPPGLNYSFYTERMGHPSPIFAWRSKFSDYLYKADPEMPVRTIKAQGGQYTGPFSWENRPFTIYELKRFQTFPDDYVIQGSRQTVIHQIGNSVPPQFARVLALGILQQVFNATVPFEITYMAHNHQLGFRARKAALTEDYAKKAKEAIAKMNLCERQKIISFTGNEYFSVEDKLNISENIHKEKASYFAKYKIESNLCEVHVSETCNVSDSVKYEIVIEPPYLGEKHSKLKHY